MLADVLRKFGSLVAGAAGPSVRANGRVWHLSPEGEALFGGSAPAFDVWLSNGSAEVVKSGPHRTVYRVRLASGVVYVKHCRINGSRAWAREVLRVPKARLEFENAARLRALGIGAAVPLAWGTPDTRWPGQSYLITRDLSPAVAFPEFIEAEALVPAERRELARELGAFVAKLHENGVAHPDPHPGNLLVVRGEGNLPPSPLPEGRGREEFAEPRPEPDGLSAGAELPLPSGRGPGGRPPPPPPFRKGGGGKGSPKCPTTRRTNVGSRNGASHADRYTASHLPSSAASPAANPPSGPRPSIASRTIGAYPGRGGTS
ncbi:MAG TPA: lipopolysaccharide kinase InaA family protein [Gemmata sp.]